MNKIFNSSFEVSLRIIILLDVADGVDMTIDKLANFDFITTYGLNFGITEINLHGENDFSFSELASRRTAIQMAMKQLVLDRLAQVQNSNQGFVYCITSAGREFSKKLNTQYSEMYRESAHAIVGQLGANTDKEITSFIDKKSRQALQRR